jgi:hypothetical protein
MKRKIQTLWKLYRRFGIAAVARSVVDRLGKSINGRQVVELVWLEQSGLKLDLEFDPKYEFRFLKADEVAKFARDASNDLDSEMIKRAQGDRDLCFAALCDGRLAAYGWYALNSIEPEHNFGVAMSYPSTVAYMYKGFTHPDFRGARLHGLGMGLALQNLADFGVTSLVSTVGWTNEASMKSCDRLGYERVGRIVTTGGAAFRLKRCPKAALERGVLVGNDAEKHVRHNQDARKDENLAGSQVIPQPA